MSDLTPHYPECEAQDPESPCICDDIEWERREDEDRYYEECCSASFTEDGCCSACGQPKHFFDPWPPDLYGLPSRDEGGEG